MSLFQLGGLVIIGLGVYILVDKPFGEELLGTNLYLGAIIILIAAAVVVSLIACFGCFGAVQEVRCMLLTVSTDLEFSTNQYKQKITFAVLHYRFLDICHHASWWNSVIRIST